MSWLCKLGLHSWDFDGLNKRVYKGMNGKTMQFVMMGHKERCRRKQCRRVRKVDAVI